MTAFFVPLVDAEDQERVYDRLAQMAGTGAPQLENRIYSITWKHGRVEWTATVGEQLTGMELIVKGRGRQQRTFEVPRSSVDTVLAIFPGVPFLIAHDGRSGIWNQPILAGNPSRVVRFSR